MATQPDLFAYVNPDILVGLQVRINRDGLCHGGVVELHPGKAMHAYSLRCSTCGEHRGWLPQASVPFLQKTISRFGRPTEPIILRNHEAEP